MGRGIKSWLACGRRTARLVRWQKVEIKYKKPTPFITTVLSAPPVANCGGGESKMIRGDSFSRDLPKLGRPHRVCRAACQRSAGHCGGIATNLNRFESLQRNLDTCSRTGQGGGGVNLCSLWGALPHGGHAQIFYRPKLLNFFLEIKQIKRRRAASGAGEVKRLGLLGVDRAASPRESPRNSELFFSSRRQLRNAWARVLFARASLSAQHSTAAKHSKKTSRNSGWGG